VRRQDIADSSAGTPHQLRLEGIEAVNLRDNAVVVGLGGGYATIIPRDVGKLHRAK
jgi:hypothetical protein